MQVRPATAAQTQFQKELVAAGLLLPTRASGITGQGTTFVQLRRRLDERISRLAATEHAELLEFAPLEPRHDMELAGYPASFPHLIGAVSSFDRGEQEAHLVADKAQAHQDWSGHLDPTELVLVPAACHPVYPALAARGPLRAEGVTVDTGAAWVFRREPSDDPCRLQAFHMRELVRCGDPADVGRWRDDWRDRALLLLQALGLPAEVDEANDPFFGRAGKVLARGQRSQQLKFEVLVPVGGDEPTALASFNAHGAHFSAAFGLPSTSSEPVHTACLGFGLERVVLALLWTHGIDVSAWPAGTLAELDR